MLFQNFFTRQIVLPAVDSVMCLAECDLIGSSQALVFIISSQTVSSLQTVPDETSSGVFFLGVSTLPTKRFKEKLQGNMKNLDDLVNIIKCLLITQSFLMKYIIMSVIFQNRWCCHQVCRRYWS